MKNYTVLITGIFGMLGSAIYRHLKNDEKCTIYGVSRRDDYLDNAKLIIGDLTSEEAYVKLENIDFDCVIHCSAEVNVNLCEKDKNHAFRSNVLATELLFSKIKCKSFFYISTDSVFDGIEGNYTEESETNPLNYYALTKLEGERVLRRRGVEVYIIRTNMFGFVNPMKNSLFEWAFKELKNGNQINGYSNLFFNPLHVSQIAQILSLMIRKGLAPGVYNLSSEDIISKYDFLIKIAEFFNFDSKLVVPVEVNSSTSLVKRALNTTLNNNKIKAMLPEFDFSIDSGLKSLYEDFNYLENKI